MRVKKVIVLNVATYFSMVNKNGMSWGMKDSTTSLCVLNMIYAEVVMENWFSVSWNRDSLWIMELVHWALSLQS